MVKPASFSGMCRQGNFSCRQSAGTSVVITQSRQGRGSLALPKFRHVGESSKTNCERQVVFGACRYPPCSKKASSALSTAKSGRSSFAIAVFLYDLIVKTGQEAAEMTWYAFV